MAELISTQNKYLRSNLRDSETYSSPDYMLFGQTT